MLQTVEALVQDRQAETIIAVAASATVAEAVDVMAAREVGAVLVKDEEQLFAGIFSERDLLVRVVQAGRDPKKTPLSMVMTRDIRFVSPGTTIEAALALMYVHRFRHLLVIDGPRVFGLISMRDLAYHLIRHGEGRFESSIRLAGGPGT
jgi:CBS domain-containing protein